MPAASPATAPPAATDDFYSSLAPGAPLPISRGRNTVWITPSGRIISSPNALQWPLGLGGEGPDRDPPMGDWWSQLSRASQGRAEITEIRSPFGVQWARKDEPWLPFIINEHIPRVGALSSLARPIHGEAVLVEENGKYRPRRSREWLDMEAMGTRLANILYTRHVFSLFSGRNLQWEPSVAPGWWNQFVSQEHTAARANRIVHIMLLKLYATISLYCAVALMVTSDSDAWLNTALEHGMHQIDARRWLEGIRNSQACRFRGVKRNGVFVDAYSGVSTRLLLAYVCGGVPVYIDYGTDAAKISQAFGGDPTSTSAARMRLSAANIQAAFRLLPSGETATIPSSPLTGEKRRRDDTAAKWAVSEQRQHFARRMQRRAKACRAYVSKSQQRRKAEEWDLAETDRVWGWRVAEYSGMFEEYMIGKDARMDVFIMHPPWDMRYDASTRRWDLFPPGILPVPSYIKGPRDQDFTEADADLYKKNLPHYTESDWTALCAGAEGSPTASLPVAEPVEMQVPVRTARARGLLDHPPPRELPLIERDDVIDVGYATFRFPSIQALLHRSGFAFRNDGSELSAGPKGRKDLGPLEAALGALGGWPKSLPSSLGRPTGDQRSIEREQAAALGLTDREVAEILDFCARLLNAGLNMNHRREIERARSSRENNNRKLVDSLLRKMVPPPFDVPAASLWLFARLRYEDVWAAVATKNRWRILDGEYYDDKEQKWNICWALELSGSPDRLRVVLHNATVVCQVIRDGRFKCVDDLVLYCTECGIRVGTPKRRTAVDSQEILAEKERRLRERSEWRVGRRAQGYKFEHADYEAAEVSRGNIFTDTVIGRAALMAGNMTWRLAMDHVYPEVALHGPSNDALRLGIGQRYRFRIGNEMVELFDDALHRDSEHFILGGWWDEASKRGHISSLKSFWPRNRTWAKYMPGAGWNVEKEAMFARSRNDYENPASEKNQPHNGDGWTKILRQKAQLGRRLEVAAEHYARELLSSRREHVYFKSTQ